MSKKIMITLISVTLVLAIGIGVLAGITKGFRDWSFGTGVQDDAPAPESGYSFRCESAEKILLSASAPANTEGNYVTKILTATVLPESAVNKAVDWSVEWGDDAASDSDVSEYVAVTPESDGSATALVTCLKVFNGQIIITVTTRESGYSAHCIVTFVGYPADIALIGEVPETEGYFDLGVGKTYQFDAVLKNRYDSVGAQFNGITCEIQAVGSFVLSYAEVRISNGAAHFYDSFDRTVTLESMRDTFLDVGFADGKLTVTTKKSIESYYASRQKLDGGRTYAYTDKFRSYAEECYFRIVITESVSGIVKEFRLRFDDAIVTGVNVGAELSF